MTRQELSDKITSLIDVYIANADSFDSNPQLRINPANLFLTIINGSDMLEEIADNEEAIEDASMAGGAESENATDFQVEQNPDFYPVKSLITKNVSNKRIPNHTEIDHLASKYTSQK